MRTAGNVALGFAFAGDEDYAKTAMDDSVSSVMNIKSEKTVSAVCEAVRCAIKKAIREFATQTHLDQNSKPQFLIGINTQKETLLRIPLKWGTNSGEVGQRRSEATLVTAMISDVPHISQEFCW